jgi:DNA-binding MarR family transcriptional regulator
VTIGAGPTLDSEITWLLHRAAQRLHVVTGEQAEKFGLQLRDHIILTALHLTPGLTQVELAKTVGLDKTTLMSQLDRLETRELIIRRPAPGDRRVRIPELTPAGNELRAQVAQASTAAERNVLQGFAAADVDTFRRMLFDIIGDSTDPGSCL